MNQSTTKRKLPWWMFALVATLCVLAIFFGILEAGNTEQGWRYVNRYLVRIGFPLFLLSFAVSSFATFWPSKVTQYLRRNRRYLGLNFALAHFTHLFAIIMLFNITGDEIDLVTLLGGGGTYVLLAIMTLTSNNYAVGKLGKNWHRLHRLGAYALWGVFTLSYVGRVFEPENNWPFVLPSALLIGALLLRIAAKYSNTRALPAAVMRPESG